MDTKKKPKYKGNISPSDVSCSCLPDHSYSMTNKSNNASIVEGSTEKSDHNYNRVSGESSNKGVKIKNTRDLKKQEDIESKRFKVKIEEVDGFFRCRCCLKTFATEILARIHVRKEKCLSKKNKKKKKKIICREENCFLEFSSNKELKKHISVSHPLFFSCPDCKKKFARKDNYSRHVLACRQQGTLYQCNQCTYVSYRKSNVDTHIQNMHHENKTSIGDLKEREAQHPAICTIVEKNQVVVGSGTSLGLFSFIGGREREIKKVKSLETDFEI